MLGVSVTMRLWWLSLTAVLWCAVCFALCPCPQMSSSKHGWGSHYTGYGDNVHVNEAGALGVTSAHASEDSIELMVGWGWCREHVCCCGAHMGQAFKQLQEEAGSFSRCQAVAAVRQPARLCALCVEATTTPAVSPPSCPVFLPVGGLCSCLCSCLPVCLPACPPCCRLVVTRMASWVLAGLT